MLRLETVEDFERIDKALSDPNSKLSDYCVVNYGYCDYCRLLSAFDHFKDPDYMRLRCRGCGNSFYPGYTGRFFSPYTRKTGAQYLYEFTLNTTEPRSKPEKEFFSREHQRKLFNERLKSRIKELKREQRVLASKVRRLAKLRS